MDCWWDHARPDCDATTFDVQDRPRDQAHRDNCQHMQGGHRGLVGSRCIKSFSFQTSYSATEAAHFAARVPKTFQKVFIGSRTGTLGCEYTSIIGSTKLKMAVSQLLADFPHMQDRIEAEVIPYVTKRRTREAWWRVVAQAAEQAEPTMPAAHSPSPRATAGDRDHSDTGDSDFVSDDKPTKRVRRV